MGLLFGMMLGLFMGLASLIALLYFLLRRANKKSLSNFLKGIAELVTVPEIEKPAAEEAAESTA